jgi:uncharacterized membrane protein HdeD (DUF308 family)
MNTNSERAVRLSAILLGSIYAVAFIEATPLAYAGMLWLGASERGWLTQVAAAALMAGWLALAGGAVFVWKAVKTRQRSSMLLGVASGLFAVAAYAFAYGWGGRMLI